MLPLLPLLQHLYGAETTIEKIQEFAQAPRLRLHLGGKNELLDHEYMTDPYPDFDTWKQQLIRFHPLKIFSNRFSRKMVD